MASNGAEVNLCNRIQLSVKKVFLFLLDAPSLALLSHRPSTVRNHGHQESAASPETEAQLKC